jgi:hypothetical protein
MADLATLLGSPITWKNYAIDPNIRALLDDLQANILKGHGRHHTGHIFLSFAGMPPKDVATVVRNLGQKCTSAFDQLRTNRREPPHLDGGPVRCLFLSATGYHALGGSTTIPPGDAFQNGMDQRSNILGDPPRAAWSPVGWRGSRPPLPTDRQRPRTRRTLERTPALRGKGFARAGGSGGGRIGRRIPAHTKLFERHGSVRRIAVESGQWRDPAGGEAIRSCTIIVCNANEWMERCQDRMPVIVDDRDSDA